MSRNLFNPENKKIEIIQVAPDKNQNPDNKHKIQEMWNDKQIEHFKRESKKVSPLERPPPKLSDKN